MNRNCCFDSRAISYQHISNCTRLFLGKTVRSVIRIDTGYVRRSKSAKIRVKIPIDIHTIASAAGLTIFSPQAILLEPKDLPIHLSVTLRSLFFLVHTVVQEYVYPSGLVTGVIFQSNPSTNWVISLSLPYLVANYKILKFDITTKVEAAIDKLFYFIDKPKAGRRGSPFSGVNGAFEYNYLFVWITPSANGGHSQTAVLESRADRRNGNKWIFQSQLFHVGDNLGQRICFFFIFCFKARNCIFTSS